MGLFEKFDRAVRRVIHPWVAFSSRRRFGADTVIGGDGFVFGSDAEGLRASLSHDGGAMIGHRVDGEPNVATDRAASGNTIIGREVKIDHFVHSARSVRNGGEFPNCGRSSCLWKHHCLQDCLGQSWCHLKR